MGAAAGQQTALPTQPTNVAQFQGGGSASNPYAQAAAAQNRALSTTAAGTSYQMNPAAAQGFQGAMDYNPEQVAATSYGAAQEAGPATAATAMQAYQNPYETQVVQQTLRDIGTQAQLGQQNLAAQAQAAKAFGGSRHGIAEAEAMKGYTQQMADAAARMRQQGFQTQLGAGQFDVGQQSASEARNIAAQNVARQFGAQTGMTAQQLNQAAGLQGANLNLQGAQAMSGADLAAAQQRMGAAQQLSNLGQRSFGYGEAIQDRQMMQGALQRQQMQNLINQGQGSFGQMTGAPTGLQNFLGGVYGAPNMAGSQTSFRPGLFNYMQLGAQMMPR